MTGPVLGYQDDNNGAVWLNRPAVPALYKADDSQSEDEREKELHGDSRDKEIYYRRKDTILL